MFFENVVSYDLLWDCLIERFCFIGFILYDVGGFGDCFFKLVLY